MKASTPGEDASFTLGELTGLKTPVKINVNSRIIEFPKKAVVNGKLQDTFYKVCEGDDINVNNYYTVSQIAEFLDVSIDGDIKVNSVPAGPETKVYEDFNLDFKVGVSKIKTSAESENADDVSLDGSAGIETGSYDELPDDDGAAAVTDLSITVIANGRPYILTGKQQYVFVDIFDKLDFDLKASNGRNIVTLLNGRDAQYLEPLKDGDVIEVRWEALK